MLPDEVIDAHIMHELEGALAWAERYGVNVTTRMPDERIIRAILVQEQSQNYFYLQGYFDQYPALPPIWDWRDDNWDDNGSCSLSPDSSTTSYGSSIFLKHNDKPIICAHFNRLAFNQQGGPHADWGDLAQWKSAKKNDIYATTIGDMLQAIARDFRHTTGRMV